MSDKPRVVAAIDFGTFASGYAWAVIDPRLHAPINLQIVHKKDWLGNDDPSAAKTRTALLIDEEDADIVAFGSEVYRTSRERRQRKASSGRVIDDFKIALKVGTGGYAIDEKVDRAVRGLRQACMSVDDAVAAYLGWIYSEALADMQRSGIEVGDVDWCLTVPAIWEQAEKDRMRSAARIAGLPNDRLTLAMEPEAAAIYVYLTQGSSPDAESVSGLDLHQAGSRFLVVDGGGGTVDISAYRIAASGGLDEIGKASGERLGSQMLNQGFIAVVCEHFGDHVATLALQAKDPAGWAEMIRNWEHEKRHVPFDPVDPIEVPLGARIDRILTAEMRDSLIEHQDGADDCIAVHPAELTNIFETVVGPTLEYIERQLSEVAQFAGPIEALENIVLAGGFAASPYLRTAIHRRFAGRARIITALHPEIAVLHGAVHYARDPSIARTRRIRFTWGIAVSERFDSARHDTARRVTIDGHEYCDTVFRVFVTDGQAIKPDNPVIQPFTPTSEHQKSIKITLFSTASMSPRYVDESGSIMSGTLAVPIDNMMHLPRAQREIEVAMYFGRSQIEVVVTNTVSKVKQKINVNYTYTHER